MSEYLDVALKAVKQAETVIMKYFVGEFAVELKADQTPVTIADKQAEQIIRDTILGVFPTHKFIGEEGGSTAEDNDEFVWIIDPVDGTKNFIRGIPLFGTLLALVHDGEFILGVSNVPAMRELLYAERGEGAFLNDKPVHVSKVSDQSETYMSYGTLKRFAEVDKQDSLLAFAETVRWSRNMGDCWGYHLLAEGKIEIMTEARTKIWDIAPFKVIVEEAGGTITQLDGSPFTIHSTDVLATNGNLHQRALDIFR